MDVAGISARCRRGGDLIGDVAGLDVAVGVRGAGEHGGHAEDGDQRAGRDEADPWRLSCAAQQDDDGQHHGDRAERGAHRVGELRPLGVLEAPDPRNADETGARPASDGGDVHDGDHRRRRPPAPERQHKPGDYLGSAHDHEDARQGRVLAWMPAAARWIAPAPTDARPANWARSAHVVIRSVRPTASAVLLVIALPVDPLTRCEPTRARSELRLAPFAERCHRFPARCRRRLVPLDVGVDGRQAYPGGDTARIAVRVTSARQGNSTVEACR